MPYTIIVCDDGNLYGSQKIKIMQKEKLFNKVWFLAPQYYNGFDMSQCTVIMRYLRPISKEFVTETLVLSDRYEEYLKYVLPVDTCLSKEWGDLELNLTFIMLDTDDEGNVIQRVRKTGNHVLTVTKLPNWDTVVPDESLAAIDQRIIMQSAQIKALESLAENLENAQVDNLVYNPKEDVLHLASKGNVVGNKVSVKDLLDDGIPVVELGASSGNNQKPDNNNCDCNHDCGCEDNVVEFGDYPETEGNIEDDSNVVEF